MYVHIMNLHYHCCCCLALVKPEPVKNVTVERIEYEPTAVLAFGQLKATISLITPKGVYGKIVRFMPSCSA